MTSEPNAPAAPAIYLYRQIDRDDYASTESAYLRIKVLTEEGRSYASMELRYYPAYEGIKGIRARTIHPDGTVVPFDGEIFDKSLVRVQGESLQAKTFTLPQVVVGSIIEYRFTRYSRWGGHGDSRWLLNADLYTRRAQFSLVPNPNENFRWNWSAGLPPGTAPPREVKGVIRLETQNVPASVDEEFMPPDQAGRYKVDFIYGGMDPEKTPEKFWRKFDRLAFGDFVRFTDAERAMRKAVAQIVQPEDSPETKLRKLYARVQALRNLSDEDKKPELEVTKPAYDVSQVLTHGYGNSKQLTYLFIALARAAGFEANPVLLPSRSRHFFHPKLMNASWLNSDAAIVKLEGKEIYLAPGMSMTPFGMLPWYVTYVPGLRLDAAEGKWEQIPLSPPTQSRVERAVSLKLSPDGTLEGKAIITFTGNEARWRRFTVQSYDEQARRDFLANDIKKDISTTAEVKLTSSPDWQSGELPLVCEVELKIPQWASPVGQRLLVPVGLFSAGEKHTFAGTHRTNPIYFNFGNLVTDDVKIALPEGWQVTGSPQPRADDINVARYRIEATHIGTELRMKRELTLNIIMLDAQAYPLVRDFYQTIRSADEDQVVVTRQTSAGPS